MFFFGMFAVYCIHRPIYMYVYGNIYRATMSEYTKHTITYTAIIHGESHQ